MNTIKTNTGENIDDYENMAVQKSNVAKRMAAGAAVFVGGAAVAGGAAYAATQPSDTEESTPLTTEDVVNGADVTSKYQPETVAEQPTTEKVVVVEKHVEKPSVEETEKSSVTWDETTNYYVGDEKVISVEEGTVDGHKFALMDINGDGHADLLAVDVDNNGRFDDNEVVTYTDEDHVHMGHQTAHVTEQHYNSVDDITPTYDGQNYVAQNQTHQEDVIHNNFEDEKTGESYHGDYAENNPDYNPNVDGDNGNDNYLAENDSYGQNDNDNYSAGMEDDSYLAETESYEQDDNVENYTAEADVDTNDSFDSMMNSEEFLG